MAPSLRSVAGLHSAAIGHLDGLRATTHWRGAPELARRRPSITVDADVLYVDNGDVLTLAGAAAGLDLCIHLVRRDFGAEVAADVARAAVMPLERAGGQAQFIVHEPPTTDGTSMGVLTKQARTSVTTVAISGLDTAVT